MSSSTQVGRRTVARTAAWATPVAVTAAGAPAFAGSGSCTDRGTATLGCSSGSSASEDDSGHECTVTSLIFGSTAVTATVGIAATDADGNTIATADDTGVFRTTTYGSAWDYVNLHLPLGTQWGDTLTMTLTFSQPVHNVTLRITDIDKYLGSWVDEVVVAPRGYAAQAGWNVIGSGTADEPFVADAEGRIDGSDHPEVGDVALLWPGLVSQVTIRYIAADSQNDSVIGQHIGVGQIGFDDCA